MTIKLKNKQIVNSIGAIDILDQKGELTTKGRFALAKNRRKLADMAEDFNATHKELFKRLFDGKINDVPPTHPAFPEYDTQREFLMNIENDYEAHQIEPKEIEKLPQGGAGALAELEWMIKGGFDALLAETNGELKKNGG